MLFQQVEFLLTHKCQCCPNVETSQLSYTVNQLTSFYMKVTLAFNGLIKLSFHKILEVWKQTTLNLC